MGEVVTGYMNARPTCPMSRAEPSVFVLFIANRRACFTVVFFFKVYALRTDTFFYLLRTAISLFLLVFLFGRVFVFQLDSFHRKQKATCMIRVRVLEFNDDIYIYIFFSVCLIFFMFFLVIFFLLSSYAFFNVFFFSPRLVRVMHCVICSVSQVPPEEGAEFQEFLKALGYTYHDETRNPVYEQFFKCGR